MPGVGGGAAGVAASVTENIVSRFSVQDDYTQQALQLASTALGVGRALAGFETAFHIAQSAMGSFAGPIRESIALNQRYQHSITDIAGSLASLHVVGNTARQLAALSGEALTSAMASDMTAARTQSRGLVQEMQRAAAALPGETQDYISTFTAAMPAFLQQTQATTGQIMEITNRATAAGITKNIGSMQAGMDLMRIMSGQAQLDVRLWNEVIRPMSQDPRTHRGGPITGQQMNALTGAQKLEVVQQALARYMPLINSFADTWETQTGTFESGVNQLKRVLGEPIFNLATEALRDLNMAMSAIQPTIERVGSAMTGWVADTVRPMLLYVKTFFDTISNRDGLLSRFDQIVNSDAFRPFANAVQTFLDAVQSLTHFGNLFGGRMGANPIADGAQGAQTSAGLLGAILGPNAAAFVMVMTQANNLERVLGALGHVVDAVVTGIMRTFGVYSAQVSDILSGGGAQDAVDTLVAVIDSVAAHMPAIIQTALAVVDVVWDSMMNVVSFAFSAGELLIAMTGFLMGSATPLEAFVDTIKILALALVGIAAVFIAIGFIILAIPLLFAGLVYALFRFIRGIGRLIGLVEEEAATFEQTNPVTDLANPPWLENLRTVITRPDPVFQRLNENARTRQPVHHNHQDFRYSRFDITQKFAEGFDPDRIAAVFASDLEAMAEQRLDSGISPAFSG